MSRTAAALVIEPTLAKSQNITEKKGLDKNRKFAFQNMPKRTENEQVRFLFCMAANKYVVIHVGEIC